MNLIIFRINPQFFHHHTRYFINNPLHPHSEEDQYFLIQDKMFCHRAVLKFFHYLVAFQSTYLFPFFLINQITACLITIFDYFFTLSKNSSFSSKL